MSDIFDFILAENAAGTSAAVEDHEFDEATQQTLVETAIALGLQADDAEFLTENANYTGHNVVKLNRLTRLKQFTTTTAITIARDKKDALYTQFQKVSLAKRRLREKILTKYNAVASASARKMLALAGKKNVNDISGQSSLGQQ